MEDYTIYIDRVEELQTLNDWQELDSIFTKARQCLVGGQTVILQRRQSDGGSYRVEEISTLPDLEAYRQRVYKYRK